MMNGTAAGTFGPDSMLTRGMMAQILYNKEGRPPVNSGIPFADVAADDWCADAVAWSAAERIITGYGNGRFNPDSFITREQLAAMLWRYSNSPVSNYNLQFTDAGQVSNYAVPAVKWAAENGVVNGYKDGRLAPRGNAARAHAAQMLKNCFDK